MIIREITVGELIGFIQSKEYSLLNIKPITPERAISQANNPAAMSDDLALVYASENDKLIGFAGLLPDELANGLGRAFSNTGWWVDKEFGRKYGLILFFKAFGRSNRRMFFTDCTEYTKSILEKTGLFTFCPPALGTRFVLNFYSGNYLRRKNINRYVLTLFYAADSLINGIVKLRSGIWRKKYLPKDLTLRFVDRINEELNTFIHLHSKKYCLKQDGDKINWIIQYPWVTIGKKASGFYPFTHNSFYFKQELLEIRKEDSTVALFFISVRDNHASIPYIYYEEDHLAKALVLLWDYLLRTGINSLVIFHSEVLEAINNTEVPSLFKIKITKFMGYADELSPVFSEMRIFQDGEGDVAFT